jgi:23S rRNA (cytidine1920-2'-O)/16S rRNA (cytidine1409-2'-O)-methyltransferase
MGGRKKQRLDLLLVEQGLAENVTEAAALIGTGRVLVNGNSFVKAGSLCTVDCQVTVKEKEPFVSRGGKKLAAGLEAFAIDPCGLICVDIGCSTGGFTDCLLQKGAARVYAVDVGYGVLDWTLRKDERVIVLERCNARYLTEKEIPEPIDLCVVDASFISLELLLGAMLRLFDGVIRIVALVKPQFELPRNKVARGGVVRDLKLQYEALSKIEVFGKSLGLQCRGVIPSPIQGAKGNQEYLMYLTGAD